MIYEFALDPGVMNSWASFRYFYDNFGAEKGRLISQFPSKWVRMVYEACSTCQDIEKKKIEVKLENIKNKLVRMSRAYESSLSWLDNAEYQHARVPFRAIVSSSTTRGTKGVLIADDIDYATPLWNIECGFCVAREACKMANCVQPMLSLCSDVLFIDPHFNPDYIKYRNTLSQFLSQISENAKICRIEYHLGDNLGGSHFRDQCNQKIPPLIPKGMEVKFIRWKQLDEGEKLHPRYILTELGGVSIEVGLDEGNLGETTDINLLSEAIYTKRWNDFQQATAAYQFIDKLTVEGVRQLSAE